MLTSRSARRAAWTIAGALAFAISLAGCSPKAPIVAPTTPVQSDQPQKVSFDLYTHCGIIDLQAHGRYFKRVGGSLSDGSGNPPDGWGNPYQRGTLSVSGDIAIFRDKLGHVERFKVAKPPDRSVALCS